MDIDFKKQQQVRDVVDRLLRRIADRDMKILIRYVQQEYPHIDSGNRRSVCSMVYSGRMASMSVTISEERLRSQIRWGDLMTCLYEEVVLPGLSSSNEQKATEDTSLSA